MVEFKDYFISVCFSLSLFLSFSLPLPLSLLPPSLPPSLPLTAGGGGERESVELRQDAGVRDRPPGPSSGNLRCFPRRMQKRPIRCQSGPAYRQSSQTLQTLPPQSWAVPVGQSHYSRPHTLPPSHLHSSHTPHAHDSHSYPSSSPQSGAAMAVTPGQLIACVFLYMYMYM